MAPHAKPLRCGILGCSDIARRKFVPALLASDRAELAAAASRTRERATTFVPGATYRALDYGELVADPGIDLVYISLPNDLHEEWTIRALCGGKHVICEKPLGLSLPAVERMLAVAEERRLLLFENLMFLQHPQHAAVAELLSRGAIGRVTTLRSVFGFPGPPASTFRLDPERGGGAFHDLARYPLGTALCFLQGENYRFRGVSLRADGLTTAVHGVALTSADEVFSFAIAFGQQYESYYELVGERGKIRLDRAYTPPAELANEIRVWCGSAETRQIVPPADQFRLTIEHVCALIEGGDFRASHERTRRLARLANQMEKGCPHG